MNVSVVLCTYTLEMYDHFKEAAESVLSQTYDEVELVVIVDGNPDVYEEVNADYGDREDVVIELNEENVGLLESRNRGAKVASGEVVAFIDDDAVADENWVDRLAGAYNEREVIAAGGKMTPRWVAGKPPFLPEEFYWLVGVTHRGFVEEERPQEVRNTFGSNISFRREVFLELDGFDTAIGGRKGDKNLQGGETELCARMRDVYGEGVWYVPDAEVEHKVFAYRTKFSWLVERAFWQGYSKRAMETFVEDSSDQEGDFLGRLLLEYLPNRVKTMFSASIFANVQQLLMVLLLTATVGGGYLYGYTRWR